MKIDAVLTDKKERQVFVARNAGLGIQTELELRRDRVKSDIEFILKVVSKIGKWTQHTELKRDADAAREIVDRMVETTDKVLDDFFEGV